MNEQQIQSVRDKAFEFGSTDSRRVAALHHLVDVERLYRQAHAALDKARRELQRAPDKDYHESSASVGAMIAPDADDMRAEIQVGGE